MGDLRGDVVKRSGVRLVAASLMLALTVAGCSEPEESATSSENGNAPTTDDCTGDALLDCVRSSTLADVAPAAPSPASGEPLLVGMVNQENTPAGSYPELSGAASAAAEFVNEDLGGVGGRPIRLEVCNTEFSAEGSTSCGQRFVEDGAVAVLGGIDVFGTAIDVLGDNGVPYVGGIPVSDSSVSAPNSFQFSGGTWGAAVAFADHAVAAGAERVSIMYGEFGSIAAAAEVGERVLERSDVSVTMVPYPVISTDLGAAIAAATSGDPDAVMLLAADSGCRAGFDGLRAAGFTGTKYFVGACASPAITEQVGNEATDGVIFNVEGPVFQGDPNPDQALYEEVISRYGDARLDPIGAGTVAFRSFMNLYRVLAELGPDATAASVAESLAEKVDEPSFAGHAYTCDRRQFTDLPAMCAPQQILAEMRDGRLQRSDDWIDVGAIERS